MRLRIRMVSSSIHCGACVARIERLLNALPAVDRARVNLSTRRVTVAWRGEAPPPLLATLNDAGFEAHPYDAGTEAKDGTLGVLVRALAVAGFAAGNIMMLSVAVWSGADAESRDLFHWLSAAIALPCLVYSGRVFFRSAWQALSRGRTNMDVPISIGVLLAFGMSLYETIHHGPHAYFDAATSLLFFLLIGRTLDHVMRERARTAVEGLARLAPRGASVRQADGSRCYLPVEEIRCCWRPAIACRSTGTSSRDDPKSTARWSRARACRGRSRPATACRRVRSISAARSRSRRRPPPRITSWPR